MFQARLLPAASIAGRAGAADRGRWLSAALALLIELLLVLMLLTLGTTRREREEEPRTTVVTIDADSVSEEAPAPRQRQAEARAERRPSTPQPPSATNAPAPPPLPATPVPAPVEIVPMTFDLAPGERRRPDRTAPTQPVYGPPDTRRASAGDSEVVGTAPNGEPLFAAQWYQEPNDEMLGAYLSTARGPGWGLIACRTAPDFRVEDCVPIAEYPEGSNIARSVLAAAWEFRVRPPRRGGQSLVGAWVRIRIDYGTGAPRRRR